MFPLPTSRPRRGPKEGTMKRWLLISSLSLLAGCAGLAPRPDAEVDVVTVTTTAQLASTAGGGDNGVNSHEVTPVAVRKLAAGTWPN